MADKTTIPGFKSKPTGDGGDLISNYACVNCAHYFSWNHTKMRALVPTCSACKSSGVVERTPRARVIVVSKARGGVAGLIARQTITRAEIKRRRFVTRNWHLRRRLKEWIDQGSNLLTQLNVSGAKVNQVREVLNAMLADVDRQQAEFLEQHNQNVERVGA